MSGTLDVTTVTNSIAALSISGVTVKDSDQIAAAIGLGFAVLCPRPDNFITGFSANSVNINKTALDIRYTLNYQYFHCEIGGDLFSDYSPMLAKIALIIKAFSDDGTLTGAIDNGTPRIGSIRPISDPSGNVYHGCDVSIDVLQFLEV